MSELNIKKEPFSDDEGPPGKKLKVQRLDDKKPFLSDLNKVEKGKEEKEDFEEAGPSKHQPFVEETDSDSADEDEGFSLLMLFREFLRQRTKRQYVVRGPKVDVSPNHILQFTVTLVRVKGAARIWRRFQVPASYTFRQFHTAIQQAMGWGSAWMDYHLHAFKVINPETRHMDDIVMTQHMQGLGGAKDENLTNIVDYFRVKKIWGRYEYDFGMGWTHKIVFEKAFLPAAGVAYPRCVGGAKACPPEDGNVPEDEDWRTYTEDFFDPEACFSDFL